MALSAGTVTVNGSGVASGGGLARAIYDSLVTMDAAITVAGKQTTATVANLLAAPIVSYIVANAAVSVTVGTGDAGLQRMPASTAVDTDCKAPAAPKTLTGTVA